MNRNAPNQSKCARPLPAPLRKLMAGLAGLALLGGADHKTLFITATESLYSIRVRVAGANPAK